MYESRCALRLKYWCLRYNNGKDLFLDRLSTIVLILFNVYDALCTELSINKPVCIEVKVVLLGRYICCCL